MRYKIIGLVSLSNKSSSRFGRHILLLQVQRSLEGAFLPIGYFTCWCRCCWSYRVERSCKCLKTSFGNTTNSSNYTNGLRCITNVPLPRSASIDFYAEPTLSGKELHHTATPIDSDSKRRRLSWSDFLRSLTPSHHFLQNVTRFIALFPWLRLCWTPQIWDIYSKIKQIFPFQIGFKSPCEVFLWNEFSYFFEIKFCLYDRGPPIITTDRCSRLCRHLHAACDALCDKDIKDVPSDHWVNLSLRVGLWNPRRTFCTVFVFRLM